MLESIKDSAESMEILESFCSFIFLWIASGVALAMTVRGKSHCEILQNCKNGVLFSSLREAMSSWQSRVCLSLRYLP